MSCKNYPISNGFTDLRVVNKGNQPKKVTRTNQTVVKTTAKAKESTKEKIGGYSYT